MTPTPPSVEAALQAYRSGSLPQALKGFLQVLTVDPKNATAHHYVSLISRELANQRGTRVHVERGAILDRAARLMMTEKQLLTQSRQAIARDDLVSAIELLWQVQAMDASSEEAKALFDRIRARVNAVVTFRTAAGRREQLRAQGVLSYLNRQWHPAIQRWQEALPLFPNPALLRQDIAKADRYLQASLQRERADLLVLKGKDLLQQGQLAGAKAAWQEALRLVPGHPDAVDGLNDIAKQETQQAERARQEELDRHFSDALERYARGQYAESRNEWNAVLRLNPEHSTAKEYLAKIEAHIGPPPIEHPASLGKGLSPEGVRHRISDVPSFPSNLNSVPDPSRSDNASDRGWKKVPRKDTAEDHYTRGIQEQTAQRSQEAIHEFEKALKLNPAHPQATKALQDLRGEISPTADDHYKQGLIAYSQGRRAEAVKEWRAVLAIDPQHPKARRALLKAESEGSRSLAGE